MINAPGDISIIMPEGRFKGYLVEVVEWAGLPGGCDWLVRSHMITEATGRRRMWAPDDAIRPLIRVRGMGVHYG